MPDGLNIPEERVRELAEEVHEIFQEARREASATTHSLLHRLGHRFHPDGTTELYRDNLSVFYDSFETPDSIATLVLREPLDKARSPEAISAGIKRLQQRKEAMESQGCAHATFGTAVHEGKAYAQYSLSFVLSERRLNNILYSCSDARQGL